MELSERRIPPCSLCGAPRVFECQLMPYIHRILSKYYHQQPENENNGSQSILEQIVSEIDWATVFIYTCSKDCDPSAKTKDQQVYHAVEFIAVHIETE